VLETTSIFCRFLKIASCNSKMQILAFKLILFIELTDFEKKIFLNFWEIAFDEICGIISHNEGKGF
jgi:hypothetical protein